MPTYTVHEQHPVQEDLEERASRLVFVKEGFAFLAFVMPAIWLLFNRLWLDFIFFVVLTVAVVAGLTYAGVSTTLVSWAVFAINLIFGFEARNVHRGSLARRGFDVLGVVTGRDLEDAERRFLSEWLPEAKANAVSSGSPPPDSGKSESRPLQLQSSSPLDSNAAPMPLGAGLAHG